MLITTKFLGPTNTRGARIKATMPHYRMSVTVSYEYATSLQDNCWNAANELATKFNASEHARFYGELTVLRFVGATDADSDAFSAETDMGRPVRGIAGAKHFCGAE